MVKGRVKLIAILKVGIRPCIEPRPILDAWVEVRWCEEAVRWPQTKVWPVHQRGSSEFGSRGQRGISVRRSSTAAVGDLESVQHQISPVISYSRKRHFTLLSHSNVSLNKNEWNVYNSTWRLPAEELMLMGWASNYEAQIATGLELPPFNELWAVRGE